MEHNAFNITVCWLNVHTPRRKMMKVMIALAQNIDPIRSGFVESQNVHTSLLRVCFDLSICSSGRGSMPYVHSRRMNFIVDDALSRDNARSHRVRTKQFHVYIVDFISRDLKLIYWIIHLCHQHTNTRKHDACEKKYTIRTHAYARFYHFSFNLLVNKSAKVFFSLSLAPKTIHCLYVKG